MLPHNSYLMAASLLAATAFLMAAAAAAAADICTTELPKEQLTVESPPPPPPSTLGIVSDPSMSVGPSLATSSSSVWLLDCGAAAEEEDGYTGEEIRFRSVNQAEGDLLLKRLWSVGA